MVKSFILQVVTAATLFGFYYLVTRNLGSSEETVYFLLLSLTGISLLLADFSFAVVSIRDGVSAKNAALSCGGGRGVIVLLSLLLMGLYWLEYQGKLSIGPNEICLLLVYQYSELMAPNYLLIIARKQLFGQSLKLSKFLLASFGLINFHLSFTLLLVLLSLLNGITVVAAIFFLKKQHKVPISSHFRLSFLSFYREIKLNMTNFLPNLGGVAINSVIPVLGVGYMGNNQLNVLVLTDRFVRSFENIFQSVIQWNLAAIKTWSYSFVVVGIAGVLVLVLFSAAAPVLVELFLNASFDSREVDLLRIYTSIAFLGPVIAIVGLRQYIYKNRSLEYALVLFVISLIAGIFVVVGGLIPLQVLVPLLYVVALTFLLVRAGKQTEEAL